MGETQNTLFEPEFNRSIKVQTFSQKLASHAGTVLLRERLYAMALSYLRRRELSCTSDPSNPYNSCNALYEHRTTAQCETFCRFFGLHVEHTKGSPRAIPLTSFWSMYRCLFGMPKRETVRRIPASSTIGLTPARKEQRVAGTVVGRTTLCSIRPAQAYAARLAAWPSAIPMVTGSNISAGLPVPSKPAMRPGSGLIKCWRRCYTKAESPKPTTCRRDSR